MIGIFEMTEKEYDAMERMYNMGKITLGEWVDYNAQFLRTVEYMECKIRSHLAEDLAG